MEGFKMAFPAKLCVEACRRLKDFSSKPVNETQIASYSDFIIKEG